MRSPIPLVGLLFALSFSPICGADDYSVGTSQGTYQGGGIAPPRKCTTECQGDYHTCVADCMRGAIETMGGCLAECRIGYCTEVCE